MTLITSQSSFLFLHRKQIDIYDNIIIREETSTGHGLVVTQNGYIFIVVEVASFSVHVHHYDLSF